MNPLQTVVDFIDDLPLEERTLVTLLRQLILDCEPRLQEKLSYGVPYFFKNRRICFLWPSSARYGPKDCKLIFGLCYGNLLSNDQKLLQADSREQVYIIRINSAGDIDEKAFREIVHEAVMIDNEFSKAKNPAQR
jgi:uncharacterized protein YdhG (YjbR/CyaY superfamily)